MDRKAFVLMALASGGQKIYSPVQVQKLLFLLDDNIPDVVGGHILIFSRTIMALSTKTCITSWGVLKKRIWYLSFRQNEDGIITL